MIDRLRSLRDRLLGSPAVRDRLSRSPIGRTIARRHGERLFGLMAGFTQSQMLVAALELGLFDRLRRGASDRKAVIEALALPAWGSDTLLRATMALGLVEPRGDRIALTVDGLVVASDPGIRAMIAHGRLLYDDLTDPVKLLREPGTGRIGTLWPYAPGQGDAAAYSRLMTDSLSLVAGPLIAAYDFGRYAHILDVGGGTGGFVAMLARRWPSLALSIADLPGVAALARTALDEQGLSRIAVHGTDYASPLPLGADAITLVRVLHDRDDAAASALLRRVADALPPGGSVIIAEPVAKTGRDPQAVYFSAYFAAMGSGRLRTRAEIALLLRSAGLHPARRRVEPSPTVSIVTARKR